MFPLLLLSILCMPAYGAQYRAALVADMDTGRVLYQENATALNYPASLTKIMTILLAVEHTDDYSKESLQKILDDLYEKLDRFVDAYLTNDGETVDEAKARPQKTR